METKDQEKYLRDKNNLRALRGLLAQHGVEWTKKNHKELYEEYRERTGSIVPITKDFLLKVAREYGEKGAAVLAHELGVPYYRIAQTVVQLRKRGVPVKSPVTLRKEREKEAWDNALKALK